MLERRYLAIKAKLEELAKDNEDLLGKISDVMNKVSESESATERSSLLHQGIGHGVGQDAVPNPKIEAIINDESSVREAKGPPAINPVANDLASSKDEPSFGGMV
nr:hypothetical protein CFP56_46380 [Quercus suber]